MNSTPQATTPNAQELAEFIRMSINQIEQTFEQMSETILTRIDNVGRRIDEFERKFVQFIPQTQPKS